MVIDHVLGGLTSDWDAYKRNTAAVHAISHSKYFHTSHILNAASFGD